MLQSPSDVNWLLSALAQASAAMIAIIGGLLVSRYVTLHGEQLAARRRVADLHRRINESNDQLGAASSALDLFYVDNTLLDTRALDALVSSGGTLTPSAALLAVDNDGNGLNENVLEVRLREIGEDLNKAFRYINPRVSVTTRHDTWAEFRGAHTPPVGNRDVWEYAYNEVCAAREKRAREEEERQRRANHPWLLDPLAPSLAHSAAFATLRGMNTVSEQQSQVAHEGYLRAQVQGAEAQTRALQQEERLATETLEATRQPEGFALALQVLSILAALGMALPVIIMGFEVVTLAVWQRVTVIGSFLLGVSLLLRFLFVYASFLREGGRAALPRTIFGLIWRARRDVTEKGHAT